MNPTPYPGRATPETLDVRPIGCPNCGAIVSVGANIHTCDGCGKNCCTACTVDGDKWGAVLCDECDECDDGSDDEVT